MQSLNWKYIPNNNYFIETNLSNTNYTFNVLFDIDLISDTTDTDCYVNQGATTTTYNQPWNPPGLLNDNRTNETKYHWQQDRGNIISSL